MKDALYEKEMFEAYIGTPEKFDWYQKAFDYFDSREGKLSWYWNSWAMIGGFWYFLYRKQMKVALIILFVTVVLGLLLPVRILPFALLFLAVALGGFGTFFVYRQYKEKSKEMETILGDKKKSILLMRYQIGGVNRLAIGMGIFTVVSFVLIMIGLVVMAGRGVG